MKINLMDVATVDVDRFKAVRLLESGELVIVFESAVGAALFTVHNGEKPVVNRFREHLQDEYPDCNLLWVEEEN